ncbi:FtsX-like permease family protein [Clostridium sp.]|uniref:ABC transporter permease n=1 Tax=Clostridium sp. TaxID=1506 RepID=UPI0032177BC7
MYSKIAVGNVKKSFKDYNIYFLTLTLAVCIFYSFNSIESQKALVEMQASSKNAVETITSVISYVSVFVSIILGCLILYANNFLVKKRKKELGIYMTLGMGKNKISKILVIETLVVGAISLISGLLLGLVASQGLSVFTSKLFDISMTEYKFIISTVAIGKTILYFGIIFLLVMIFNTVIISKYKIIDLLTAGRKNEDVKFKNPIIYLITFVLCVVSLGVAYKLVLKVGLNVINPRFMISILLGILGTSLFFFSLAGFGLYLLKKNKKVYFKGLNIFIAKQINSKVNTNFISMTIICLMLFLTMSILSTGISFKNALESGLENTTPFDASATIYIYNDDKIKSIKESFENINFKFDESEKYAYYTEYGTDATINDLLDSGLDKSNKDIVDKFGKIRVSVIKISEYNDIRKLQNKESIELKEDEVLITSNFTDLVKSVNVFLNKNNSIEINSKDYNVKNEKVIEDAIHTSGFSDNIFTLVVNDELTKELNPEVSYINVNFEGDKKKSEDKFANIFKEFKDGKFDYDKSGFVIGMTREQVYSETKGMTTTILFVGIYLGIIFLIASMAVLALQQLSEASDSIDRYKSLKKIGANDKMINKTIFVQTLIYFSLPVILAFIHSVIGIKVANEFISIFNKPNIVGSSLITASIFMIVYVGYFYATYTGYKNIVRNNQ